MNSKKIGKKAKKKLQQKKKIDNLPFVSVCTPTFNRRPFIPYIIKCYLSQDYPQDKMEWIIVDDGTDKIGDLVKDISGVKYFPYDEKMKLGKKRNTMHEKCSGDIIVYMDDDDFYPPNRVSHAVEKLQKNTKALCSGSSEIYIYFKHIQQMYRFGPYSPNHSTAGTFAFKKELLKITKYNDDASLAEEKDFLKNYTIPFVQLDPLKTILVFSHNHNTFDKKKLLENGENKFVNKSSLKVEQFIKDDELRKFYSEEIDNILKDYEPGDPKNKPDVIEQTESLKKEREQMQINEIKKKIEMGEMFKDNNGNKVKPSIEQISELIFKQNQDLLMKNSLLKEKDQIIDELNLRINLLENRLKNKK